MLRGICNHTHRIENETSVHMLTGLDLTSLVASHFEVYVQYFSAGILQGASDEEGWEHLVG